LSIINPYLRGNAYKHFSLLYQYHEKDFFSSFKDKKQEISALFKNLADVMCLPLEQTIDKFINSLDELKIQDVQSEYVRLFDYRPVCPSFESFFLKSSSKVANTKNKNPAKMQIAIEEFYRDYGIKPANYGEQPPDHITTELEFMYYLCFCEGEAKSNQEEVIEYITAQSNFMQDHLILWVPKFCEIIENSTRLDFYRLLSVITRNVVSRDASYLHSKMEG
jgi:TorA maturation chaperone TorD